jgi:hypothetical protein
MNARARLGRNNRRIAIVLGLLAGILGIGLWRPTLPLNGLEAAIVLAVAAALLLLATMLPPIRRSALSTRIVVLVTMLFAGFCCT